MTSFKNLGILFLSINTKHGINKNHRLASVFFSTYGIELDIKDRVCRFCSNLRKIGIS